MATTHLHRTVHKHGGRIRSAQRVQYITREGTYAPHPAPAAARVAHLDRQPGGQAQRDDLVVAEAQNMPSWAQDAGMFFVAAEKYEGANRAVSTEWKFSLPRELSRDQQLAAARDVMHSLLGNTHPYVWAMHEPLAADGQPQPHVHCLWSSRTLDGIERSPEQFFKRYNAADPSKGGAQKDPALIAYGQAKRERQAYSDLMNMHLERAGSRERLHPGKLTTLGIDREPEPRAMPSDSNAAKYRGEITELWGQILDHRQRYAGHRKDENQRRADAWERRKEELGITDVHSMSREEMVGLIAEHTREQALHPQPQPTLEDLKAEVVRLRQEVQHLERDQHRIHAQVMAEEHRQRHQEVSPARARLLGIVPGMGDDDVRQGGLTVEIDERKKRGRGIGW